MSALKTHITIPKQVASKDDLDFQFLKKVGIEYIESLGGNLWTDYNTHDPGITILDMLCYVVSDLGNRVSMPIEDLLSRKDGSGYQSQFHLAEHILPNRALTVLDYRKLFINIDGVRNCWLMEHKRPVYVNCKDNELSYDINAYPGLENRFRRSYGMKGLYDLLIDFDIPESLEKGTPAYTDAVEAIKENVRTAYHANRNLCEDLISIREVEEHPVSVCAKIEVEKNADEEQIHARVLFEIEKYFSPQVAFYSLKEMTAKGFGTSEIFDGPLLEYTYEEEGDTYSGIHFIDSEELRASSLRKQVRLSDIMNIISSIEGVKEIIDISVANCDGDSPDEWLICIDEGKRPVLCQKSTFNYTKDVLILNLNETRVEQFLDKLRNDYRDNRRNTISGSLTLPEGQYLDTGWYSTMQNDFPDTYGIGIYGLPSTATIARKSQAKQLKAYLLFFDQILASYFAQLESVKDLLAFDGQLKRTYYTQAVEDISGFDDLVSSGYPLNDSELLSEELFGDLDQVDERKNLLLDHLIARFAEKFSEYTFLMKQVYGSAATELTVAAKQRFLKDYPNISANRGGAFNYYRQSSDRLWDTDNVSGAEVRIARLAGFKEKDFWRRNLSASFVEIYDLLNTDNEQVFRWRIRDADGNIVLSATDDYPNRSKASAELHLAVLQIIQTGEEEIIAAYETGTFGDNVVVGNFLIQKSDTGLYSFDIINPGEDNPNYIIARQYTYYSDTGTETGEYLLKEAILSIIGFMKFVFSEEGIFLVENILLRPDVTDNAVTSDQFMTVKLDECRDCSCIDTYSYRVNIVLPGYTFRFANMNFRDFLENLIREELPAHILPRICWVGNRRGEVDDPDNELYQFEKTYKAFLLAKTNSGQQQDINKLKECIAAIENLHTIYPTGQLYDCESEDVNGKIILGRTNLGTL